MSLEVELDLFSGRPNPSLELREEEARHLARNLERLPRTDTEESVELPGLGYRGVQIRGGVSLHHPEADPAKPIRIYAGVVRQGAALVADQGRDLERRLLEALRDRLDPSVRPLVEQALREL